MTDAPSSIWHRAQVRFALLLVLFVSATFGTVRLFERMLLSEVQSVTEAANVAFTRVFGNESWGEVRTMLDLEARLHPRENPRLRDVDARVRQFAKGTDTVKVKIYNTKGLTVYSSDPAQLGEDKAANAGFQAAVRGRVASETNYRGKFGAFDGEIFQRNLVSSYVPVRAAQGVEAVVEIYTDRTASVEGVEAKIRKAWIILGSGMTVALLLTWLLMQAGRQPKSAGARAAEESAGASAAERAEARACERLVDEAVLALRDDGRRLNSAFTVLEGAPADASAWREMRAPLHAVCDHIEALSLARDPLQAASSAPNDIPAETLGAAVEGMVKAVGERHRDLGLDIVGSVAVALADRKPATMGVLLRLVGLLLEEGAQRTGQGQLRLSLQPAGATALQIELIGARAQVDTRHTPATEATSLRLLAVQALAGALRGHIERASITPRGPWFTVTLPLGS